MSAINTVMLSGPMDPYLTSPADFSHFTSVHKTHTPFAMEPKLINFVGGNIIKPGRQVLKANIGRYGDVITDIFLVVELPALDGGETYKNRPLMRLLKSFEISVGNSVLDKIYGQYVYAWEELSKTVEQKHYEEIEASPYSTKKMLHLPLFFSKFEGGGTGQCLRLVGMQYNRVHVTLEINPLTSLTAGGTFVAQKLQPVTDVHVQLLVDYAMLGDEERAIMASTPYQSLITEVQRIDGLLNAADGDYVLPCPFNHAVREIIIMSTETGEFIPLADTEFHDGQIVQKVQLKLNNQERYDSRVVTPQFLHWVARKCHSGSRKYANNLLVLPFSFSPEDDAPSGSLNFSRFDNTELHLSIKSVTGANTDVAIFARSHNLLRIQDGIASLAFAS